MTASPPHRAFRHVMQICVVVRDLDEAVRRYWDRYGIGPWHLFTYLDEPTDFRGAKTSWSYRVGLAKVDDYFQWEIIQPLDEDSIYSEFLRTRGEGVHHVAFDVDDVSHTMDSIRPLLFGEGPGVRGGTGRFAMLDTEADLGVIAEVFEFSPDWVRPGADGVYPPSLDGSVPEIAY